MCVYVFEEGEMMVFVRIQIQFSWNFEYCWYLERLFLTGHITFNPFLL